VSSPYNPALKPKGSNAIANTMGIATVTLSPPNTYRWTIYQITVMCNGSSLSSASVSVDGIFYCGSNSGNEDAADGNPLVVNAGSNLTVTWTNASPGSTCTANLLVTETEVGQ
jgi:hypothetical protein